MSFDDLEGWHFRGLVTNIDASSLGSDGRAPPPPARRGSRGRHPPAQGGLRAQLRAPRELLLRQLAVMAGVGPGLQHRALAPGAGPPSDLRHVPGQAPAPGLPERRRPGRVLRTTPPSPSSSRLSARGRLRRGPRSAHPPTRVCLTRSPQPTRHRETNALRRRSLASRPRPDIRGATDKVARRSVNRVELEKRGFRPGAAAISGSDRQSRCSAQQRTADRHRAAARLAVVPAVGVGEFASRG